MYLTPKQRTSIAAEFDALYESYFPSRDVTQQRQLFVMQHGPLLTAAQWLTVLDSIDQYHQNIWRQRDFLVFVLDSITALIGSDYGHHTLRAKALMFTHHLERVEKLFTVTLV
jgi:hypothetical protein